MNRWTGLSSISVVALLGLGALPRPTQEQAPAALPLDIQWGQLQWGELSPDGRELGLTGPDASLVLLDIETGRVRLTIPHHRGIQVAGQEVGLEDATWSPSGKLLARLYEDGRVELVSVGDGALEAVLATAPRLQDVPSRVGRSVRFASEHLLVVAHGTTPAEIWSLSEQRQLAEISTPEGPATALAISADGELVALGDQAGNVGIWRLPTGESTGKELGIGGKVSSLAFHPDTSMLAIGAYDHDVRLWSFDGPSEVRRLSHRDADLFDSLWIGRVAFSPNGKRLLSTSFAFWEARVWDLASGRELWRYNYDNLGGNEGPLGARFTTDGRRVLLSLRGAVLDSESGKLVKTLFPNEELEPWFGSDGRRAWTMHEGRLLVFSLAGDCEKLLDLPIATSDTEAK